MKLFCIYIVYKDQIFFYYYKNFLAQEAPSCPGSFFFALTFLILGNSAQDYRALFVYFLGSPRIAQIG